MYRSLNDLRKRLDRLEEEIRSIRREVDALKDEFSYIRERISELEGIIERGVKVRGRRRRSYAWVLDLLREHGFLTPITEGNTVSLFNAEGKKVVEIRYRRLLEKVIERAKIIRDESGREWLIDEELYESLMRKLPLRREEVSRVLNEKEEKLLELLNRAGYVLLKGRAYVKAT